MSLPLHPRCLSLCTTPQPCASSGYPAHLRHKARSRRGALPHSGGRRVARGGACLGPLSAEVPPSVRLLRHACLKREHGCLKREHHARQFGHAHPCTYALPSKSTAQAKHHQTSTPRAPPDQQRLESKRPAGDTGVLLLWCVAACYGVSCVLLLSCVAACYGVSIVSLSCLYRVSWCYRVSRLQWCHCQSAHPSSSPPRAPLLSPTAEQRRKRGVLGAEGAWC